VASEKNNRDRDTRVDKLLLQIQPAESGKFTSRIRQAGGSILARAMNLWAEAKVSTSNPSDRSRLSTASRTSGSSSTTQTEGTVFFIGVFSFAEFS